MSDERKMSDGQPRTTRRPNGRVNRDNSQQLSTDKSEAVRQDWNETVYLRGLHALRPGQRMAAGFLRRTTLRNAVREVMEDWTPLQRPSAAILRDNSIYHHHDIERFYLQPDFPQR
jgi:hypothetical protein